LLLKYVAKIQKFYPKCKGNDYFFLKTCILPKI